MNIDLIKVKYFESSFIEPRDIVTTMPITANIGERITVDFNYNNPDFSVIKADGRQIWPQETQPF